MHRWVRIERDDLAAAVRALLPRGTSLDAEDRVRERVRHGAPEQAQMGMGPGDARLAGGWRDESQTRQVEMALAAAWVSGHLRGLATAAARVRWYPTVWPVPRPVVRAILREVYGSAAAAADRALAAAAAAAGRPAAEDETGARLRALEIT